MIATQTSSLHEHLVTCERFLRDCGESYWASNLEATRSVDAVGNKVVDIYALMELFSPGQGFTELTLSPLHGHNIEHGDSELLANVQLSELRLSIFHLANKHQRGEEDAIAVMSGRY
ncbi:hypothetical protein [Flexibacterium corallicola]|uniref:hypothetical protein n=1 Tax=Flexibacterium corallicola TaxID=3037259 RepID=UPI00286FAE12|nr:hypothetical protein [Pseudovibrio sp. M1P-2-3]